MQVLSRFSSWVSVYKIVAIVGALLLALAALDAHRREDAFALRGVATEALSVQSSYAEHVTRDNRSGAVTRAWTSADLSFHTEDGEAHTVTRGLEAPQLEALMAGQPLRVEYLREQPESTLRLAGRHEQIGRAHV